MFPSSYVPLSGEDLQNINNTAEHLLTVLRRRMGDAISYDGAAVKALSDDIDRNRMNYSEEEKKKIIWMYGAFLGRAIIETYSNGRNIWVDNKVDNYCVKVFTSRNEETIAAPFTRVIRHFEDGPETSMIAYFVGIGHVAQNGLPPRSGTG